jgi:ABC-type molybdate transport system substrate-binding protein
MRSSKSIFFAIIGLAVVVVVGLLVARFFLADTLDLPPVSEQISIRIVVAPSIKPWVDQAAQEFNQANRNIQVKVVAADDLIPESQFSAAPSEAPPAAWLAEASFAVEMAASSGLSFEDAQSVAGTSLAWGAYNDKLAQFNQAYGPLTWENVHAKATNSSDLLKIVIASPQNSAAGIGALGSATSAHLGKPALSGSDVSGANDWLLETFGDRNTQIPPTPAQAFAGVQGRTIGDMGLLALAEWRSVGLDQSPDFTITPAEPNVNLDYPFAIWAGRQATPEAKQAAVAFRNFLLSEAQQNNLANFFFERAGTAPPDSLQLDSQAAINLLRWAEREIR